MTFRAWHRDGPTTTHGSDADVPAVVDGLLNEFEGERPQWPHDKVEVGSGSWSLVVWRSGLLSLADLSRVAGSQCDVEFELRRWAADPADAARVMALVAAGRPEAVLAQPGWVGLYEQLPPAPGPDFLHRMQDAPGTSSDGGA
jgi:hypothetical protein